MKKGRAKGRGRLWLFKGILNTAIKIVLAFKLIHKKQHHW